jgi:hypothetical protein
MKYPAAADITALHDHAPGEPPRHPDSVWAAIEANHRHNSALWAEEDLARRRNVPDSEIAANKRAIDSHNQKRNDAIERIDEALLATLEKVTKRPEAKQNSETAGAMVDRLSILSLKIKAMREQTERKDVDRTHIESCLSKLNLLVQQRDDLAACFDRLLGEAAKGEAFFKVYRQFKMYNDPKLNPAMYSEKGGTKR